MTEPCPNPDCIDGIVNKGRDPQWDALCPVCKGDGEVNVLDKSESEAA